MKWPLCMINIGLDVWRTKDYSRCKRQHIAGVEVIDRSTSFAQVRASPDASLHILRCLSYCSRDICVGGDVTRNSG